MSRVADCYLRIQEAIRHDATRSREVVRVGPFTATFAGGTNPFLNYAIPDAGAEPTAEDVAALVEICLTRGHRPRLEYLPALAPAVEPALLAAGFAVEARTPLMRYRSSADATPPDGIELAEARTREELRAAASAQFEAYEEEGEPPESWVDGLQRATSSGALLVLARDAATGEVVGAGQCTNPHEGATELTSVGVRARYRRRGIARALTARLAATMAERGADLVFLMAAGEDEARVYERAGFERIGEALYVARA